MTSVPIVLRFLVVAATLAVLAWRSPVPDRVTDRAVYEATAALGIVADCSDLHCFRVLVAWTLGAMPGPSLAKWKVYAVVANAGAAVAVWGLAIAWGLSRRAAVMAMVASGLGFGSLYTLHDVYTSDPLMYALAPLVLLLLTFDRVAAAGAVAAVGVLAKEFVAAPLFMASVAGWWDGRRAFAIRALIAGNAAFIVWLLLQLTLIVRFNYSYDDNPSTHLLGGGYLAHWLSQQSPRAALAALVAEFGALWVLAPVGLLFAPRPVRRMAAVSLPVAALFAYVQQPDRALWNFHFLVTPLAALALERAPATLAWATLATFAFANLRVGAQLPGVPAARFALVLSMLLAIACSLWAWRAPVVRAGGPAYA